ncbi:MAG TPA: hypothetical protein VF849_00190 [Blattabacteriaceae bacterium]
MALFDLMKNPSNEEEPVTGTGIQQEAGKKENINLDHIFPFDDDIIGPSKNAHLKYVNVRQLSTRVLPRFNLVMEKFRITFRHKLPNDIGQVDLITRALKELVAFSQKQTDFKPGDKLNVFIENPKFTHRIASGYECTDHVNRLKDKIAQILTSDESINIAECIFHVHTLNVPRGSGRSLILNLAKDRKTKQCILEIKNKDIYAVPVLLLLV